MENKTQTPEQKKLEETLRSLSNTLTTLCGAVRLLSLQVQLHKESVDDNSDCLQQQSRSIVALSENTQTLADLLRPEPTPQGNGAVPFPIGMEDEMTDEEFEAMMARARESRIPSLETPPPPLESEQPPTPVEVAVEREASEASYQNLTEATKAEVAEKLGEPVKADCPF